MSDAKETTAIDDFDHVSLGRLPIPLGQLCRRACNAKTAFERHLTAFYLWEASLKLLGSVAIVEYADLADRDPNVIEQLKSLARPSTGHWWEFARTLTPILAESGRESFAKQRDVLFGKSRRDLPSTIALHAALGDALDDRGGSRQSVRVSQLFERMVRYRNREIGHGAAGRRRPEFYDAMGKAILAGMGEILAELDVLAGQQLVYVSSVRRQDSGTWLVQQQELTGFAARSIASQDLPESADDRTPQPERVYLLPAPSGRESDGARKMKPLHPLVVYDANTGDMAFLNARRDGRQVEYLSYTSGKVHRETLADDHCQLMVRVLGIPVDEDQVTKWSKRSLDDQPPNIASDTQTATMGRTLGEFELLSQIGRGGMGVVYRAWQPSLGREVALKSLVRTGDAQSEARFGREIRALGRVEHPNLIKVFTSGVDEDQWFYVMELIEGADLSHISDELVGADASTLAEGQWRRAITTALEKARSGAETLDACAATDTVPTETPARARDPRRTTDPANGPLKTGGGHLAQVVEIVRQVAAATHTLHEAGVVHRDIKPANIMLVGARCHAVLMDLGIAQIADEVEGRLTRTRQFVGTLRYASPEQLISASTVDRRTDIYSLGATLWELLTLQPLYGATDSMSTPELMRRIQSQEPDRPRKHNPRIPRDLEAITLKCLERDRDRRYQTAAELAEDLVRWQRDEPVLAQPPTLTYILGKHVRRHKLRFATVAAMALLAVLGTVVAVALIDDTQRQAQRREAELLFEQSFSTCVEKGPTKGVLSLARSLQVAEEAKNEELAREIRTQIAAWERPIHPLRTVIPAGSAVTTIAFSPDGRILASGCAANLAQLWDARDGTPIGAPMPCDASVSALAFRPDGKAIVTASVTGRLQIWDVRTCQPTGDAFGRELDTGVSAVAFSPDGKFILAGYRDGDVSIFRSSGRLLGDGWSHEDPISAVAFSPDGRLAISGDRQGRVCFVQTRTQEPAATDIWSPGAVWTLKPNSATDLLIGSGVGRLAWEQLPTLSDQNDTELPSTSGGALFQLPDPRWQYVVLDQRQLAGLPGRDIAVAPQAAPPPVPRAPPPVTRRLSVQAMAISANASTFAVAYDDGKTILSLPGRNPGEREQVGLPLEHPGDVLCVAYHPEFDRVLATGCADATVRIWEIQPENIAPRELQFGHMIYTMALAPDDRTLAVAGEGGAVRMWNIESGEAMGHPLRHAGIAHALAFSPDGRLLLIGGSESRLTRLWDVRSGTAVGAGLEHDDTVNAAAFSPNGRIIATGCDDRMTHVWDGETLQPIVSLPHDDEVYCVAFSPDGQLLVTGSKDRTARLWSVPTGEMLTAPIGHPGTVYCVVFSPDGKRIIVGGEHGAQLWDIQSETPVTVGQPMLHDDDIRDAVFSADGRYAVTVALDKRIRLWDAHTARAVGYPLLPDSDFLSSVVLTRDGKYLATGSSVGAVSIRRAVPSLEGPAEQIGVWAELVTGHRLTPSGVLQPLDADAWRQRATRLEQLGGTPIGRSTD